MASSPNIALHCSELMDSNLPLAKRRKAAFALRQNENAIGVFIHVLKQERDNDFLMVIKSLIVELGRSPYRTRVVTELNLIANSDNTFVRANALECISRINKKRSKTKLPPLPSKPQRTPNRKKAKRKPKHKPYVPKNDKIKVNKSDRLNPSVISELSRTVG